MFHAEFELTNYCNTRCLQCPHEIMSRPRGRLEWPVFETVVAKIRSHVGGERFSLSFSGMGEPLLHPLVFECIGHVSDQALTSFSSNAAALTEKNVTKLVEAGLDVLYISFNGDEPVLFTKMMGGLDFEQVLKNVRRAIALSKGSRTKMAANISVTVANRHRVTQIKEMLESEGIDRVLFSMCHTRGGNLHDPEVFDTPALPTEITRCAVLESTLFIDWRGKVFICDHDIHGEYPLGDLTNEPLSVVLERRQKIIAEGLNFKICRECNDVMKMATDDEMRQWIYGAYSEEARQPLGVTDPRMKWIYDLYQKANREDYFIQRLLAQNQTYKNRVEALEQERKSVHAWVTWPLVRLERMVRNWLA